MIAPVMVNMREIAHGHESPSDSCKSEQRCGRSTSPSCDYKKSCTPEGRPLLPPPMFHSTALPMLRRLSSNLPEPSSAHLSFNQSRSSIHPLNLGGGMMPVPSCPHGHAYAGGCPVHHRSIITICTCTPAMNFSEDHIKQIFSLTCKG